MRGKITYKSIGKYRRHPEWIKWVKENKLENVVEMTSLNDELTLWRIEEVQRDETGKMLINETKTGPELVVTLEYRTTPGRSRWLECPT